MTIGIRDGNVTEIMNAVAELGIGPGEMVGVDRVELEDRQMGLGYHVHLTEGDRPLDPAIWDTLCGVEPEEVENTSTLASKAEPEAVSVCERCESIHRQRRSTPQTDGGAELGVGAPTVRTVNGSGVSAAPTALGGHVSRTPEGDWVVSSTALAVATTAAIGVGSILAWAVLTG